MIVVLGGLSGVKKGPMKAIRTIRTKTTKPMKPALLRINRRRKPILPLPRRRAALGPATSAALVASCAMVPPGSYQLSVISCQWFGAGRELLALAVPLFTGNWQLITDNSL